MHYLDFDSATNTMPNAMGKVASMADWAAENDNDFWVGMLVGAYEFIEGNDNDPTSETFPVFGIAMPGTPSAFVFFETSRDYVAAHAPGPPWITDEATFHARSSLHETGHFFGLADYYLPTHPRGIMNYYDATYGTAAMAVFNWNDLAKIQSTAKPQV